MRKIVLFITTVTTTLSLGGCQNNSDIPTPYKQLMDQPELTFIREMNNEHYKLVVPIFELSSNEKLVFIKQGVPGWTLTTYLGRMRKSQIPTPLTVQCQGTFISDDRGLSDYSDVHTISCQSDTVGTVIMSNNRSSYVSSVRQMDNFLALHRQVRESELPADTVPMVNPVTGK